MRTTPLNAMLVFGGQDPNNPTRSNRAIDLIQSHLMYHEDKKLYIILSGGYYGMREDSSGPTDAENLRVPLLENLESTLATSPYKVQENQKVKDKFSGDIIVKEGQPKIYIIKEETSQDTLLNVYDAWNEYLHLLLNHTKANVNIGLVTDEFHMNRAHFAAKIILPSNYELFVYPAEKQATKFQNLQERIILGAWHMDLKKNMRGNQVYWKNYFTTKHPFRAENPKFSAYGAGVMLKKGLSSITNL